MSVVTDPSLYSSNFERNENDAYYTESWCTKRLLPFIPDDGGMILEPACGRGDLARVLVEDSHLVLASDIDIRHYDRDLGSVAQQNFLEMEPWDFPEGVNKIITNPPYGKDEDSENRKSLSEQFVRQALSMPVDFVAMLLRSEFNHAKGRRDLFETFEVPDAFPFAFEIVFTSRPLWDWWFEKDPWEKKAGPRHNFSWFCWSKKWPGRSTQFWAGREE